MKMAPTSLLQRSIHLLLNQSTDLGCDSKLWRSSAFENRTDFYDQTAKR